MIGRAAHLAGLALTLSLCIIGERARAEPACLLAGEAFGEGAARCLPGVEDGRVEHVLHHCTAGAWTSAEVPCPPDVAYHCAVGPHAIAIGEVLRLGTGPAAVECVFPGHFRLRQTEPATAAPSAAPSDLVRRVQHYLSDEAPDAGAPLTCATHPCDGYADPTTMAAIAAHIRLNAANLTAAELAAFGADAPAAVEGAIRERSAIDIIPAFIRIFDVPTAN